MEHILPAFREAMCHPDNMALTVIISVTVYILGGYCCCLGLLAGLAWVGTVYCCCHEQYSSYVELKLCTDMKDIQASFLVDPDSCFWVAEANVNGEPRIFGMVAVVREVQEESNGSEEEEHTGEIFRMSVSSSCRRKGLGIQLTQTAIEFCQERKFSRVMLWTSSTQVAAIALYRRLGFTHTLTLMKSHLPDWVTWISKMTTTRMDKVL